MMKPLHIATIMLMGLSLGFSGHVLGQSGESRQNRNRFPRSATHVTQEETRIGADGSQQIVTKGHYTSREQVMVIPLQQFNPITYGEMQEDMKVMARVLDNCLLQNTWGKPQIGDGFQDFGDFFTAGRETESIYLEGYGILFLMKVDFPLSPVPQNSASSEETNTPPDTTWERAKQDVLSNRTAAGMSTPGNPAERFDADKLETIKQELLRSLQYATHIRHLSANGHIILRLSRVTEYGMYEQTRFEHQRRNFSASGAGGGFSGGMGGGFGMGRRRPAQASSPSSATQLVIRTRKSDVDAFAQGTIDFEAFCQRATLITQ